MMASTARDLKGAHLLSGFPLWGEGMGMPLMAAVFQEPTTGRMRVVDPRDTWMLFVRHSDKGVNGKRGGRGKAKKLKVSRGAPASMWGGSICRSCPNSPSPPPLPSQPTPAPTAHPEHWTQHRPSPSAWGQRTQQVPSGGPR